jgi:nucleoside-diphosphate-sugar epimerase
MSPIDKIALLKGTGFVGNRLAARLDQLALNYLVCDINIKYGLTI